MSLQCPFTKQDCVFYGRPHHHHHHHSKERDDMAVSYVQAVVSGGHYDRNSPKWKSLLAKEAYEMADVLLEARKPPESETP